MLLMLLLVCTWLPLMQIIFLFPYRTRDTLNQGNLLSVINVLMQLRKVCNHPNLFEPRPIVSPFQTDGINYGVPSLVWDLIREVQEESFVSIYVVIPPDGGWNDEKFSPLSKLLLNSFFLSSASIFHSSLYRTSTMPLVTMMQTVLMN